MTVPPNLLYVVPEQASCNYEACLKEVTLETLRGVFLYSHVIRETQRK